METFLSTVMTLALPSEARYRTSTPMLVEICSGVRELHSKEVGRMVRQSGSLVTNEIRVSFPFGACTNSCRKPPGCEGSVSGPMKGTLPFLRRWLRR